MVLHVDVVVTSMDAALTFYCDQLGFSLVDDGVLQGPLVKTISAGLYERMRLVLLRVSMVGSMIELLEFQHDGTKTLRSPRSSSSTGVISIMVSDLDSQIEAARRKGLDPTTEIFSVTLARQGHCKVVFYEDPDGNRLEFVQMIQAQTS